MLRTRCAYRNMCGLRILALGKNPMNSDEQFVVFVVVISLICGMGLGAAFGAFVTSEWPKLGPAITIIGFITGLAGIVYIFG